MDLTDGQAIVKVLIMTDSKNEGIPGAPRVGEIAGHEYVDLGLGVLWATCNVGASSQYDSGQYFAWGETDPKDEYTQENYKAKGKNKLELADDHAHVHWGGSWRMPTSFELDCLIRQCEWDYHRTEDDMPYFRVTSKSNGNSIVLPLAGYREAGDLKVGSEKGHLWGNASLEPGACNAPCLSSEYCYAWECEINKCGAVSRYLGVPVRPVSSVSKSASKSPQDLRLEESMPKLIRVALEKCDKKADLLLGYRMVMQRKAASGDSASDSLLEDEIRFVDGSVFTQSAEGEFEHAFFQFCLPMVHYKYRTVQLSSCETRVYVDGIDRARYWTYDLFDVPGGEEEVRHCLCWLREWIGSHQDATRILDPGIVANDLRREGKRVPVKMHICYTDVPDPECHGWCTPRLARGHQDIVAWDNEEALERMKPDYLLAGKLCGYGKEVEVAAKMRLDETLGINCRWLDVHISWAAGDYERLTQGMRFLTAEDVALLRKRLEIHGPGISPEVLYDGLGKVCVRRRYWNRTEPYRRGHFFEDYLLPGSFSTMDEEWEAHDKAIPLSAFSVEEMALKIEKKPAQ